MKPTQALAKRLRRLALTTKQTNKGYYKGTGSGSMGSHTKHGGYLMDWEKVRTYVVPENLSSFKLTPFITKNMAARPSRFQGDPKGAFSGEAYLQKWKDENGEE
ncbi:related to MRPL27-mitochondrial ribosomal protein, large subunit [Rhynchosporium agropyri]|uniref:Related to MRPL27-mitochondrial ribosomal protein, large subunit n=3 Tax=Rhynchosporium TaxID=38037 RepID=A0A1E1LW85_RHYSE|nr:related to MRPL27-mitochondrial ribosomal protein, large subunit [Rhynchosporium agropyri]CZT13689.1 related to MRPL27-mitochondrial ribosomal protein, large subunit [Rhynchosporium commune]CZT41133.1 related to MRPL27-mitochondrial ribosomal protein, large subunit [Rhynchosporium secalis]